jgi:hypothetical protein
MSRVLSKKYNKNGNILDIKKLSIWLYGGRGIFSAIKKEIIAPNTRKK